MPENHLKKIEELANLQFLPREIAVILGVDEEEFEDEILLKQGERYVAYKRGQLIAEAEVRKSIYTMAKQGSSPAQKQMLDIIDKNKQNLLDAENG